MVPWSLIYDIYTDNLCIIELITGTSSPGQVFNPKTQQYTSLDYSETVSDIIYEILKVIFISHLQDKLGFKSLKLCLE